MEGWAPIGGIVFVVLMVVSSILIGDVPDPDAPEHEIADYLANTDNPSTGRRSSIRAAKL
jgi:hypothetical protein